MYKIGWCDTANIIASCILDCALLKGQKTQHRQGIMVISLKLIYFGPKCHYTVMNAGLTELYHFTFMKSVAIRSLQSNL